ncbi:MAG: ATP-binding cassette domain-containing protein, partial [Planctomycetes bacterium]|nr:ATP-binding cassette domain-containing protein [Planctomycetota bacterium]
HHLLPEFTALENITLPQRFAGVSPDVAAARATDLLASVGLTKRADHRPAELSGGEQQRVAFCRALANEPAILLADEPTGNLDAETGGQLMKLLSDLHHDGQTIIMVTHDAGVATYADRVLQLHDGALRTSQ